MFNLKISVFAVTLLAAVFVDAQFPENPKPCPYGDSECIKNIVNFLLSEKIDGYSSLNLVSLNPLKISEISIKQGADRPVSIDLQLRNNELTGIKDAKALQVKGFGKDLTQPHEIVLGTDSLTLLSDYTINGRVRLLPISGTGRSNITLDNVKLKLTIFGEPLDKDGATYMVVNNVKLSIETSRVHFDFTNLFNGDKALGDIMNEFINDPWMDLYEELNKEIIFAMEMLISVLLSNDIENTPYSKLFAAE